MKTLVSPITVLLLALVAAAWASETLVVRHVRSLISTAEEIATGNMHARSDVDYDEHELGQLAEALDMMAEEIEQQQSELKQRNENNQVIAQEMQHRIANTLTLARIIATQSLRHSRSRQEFIETYGKRLQALAVSNRNLLQGNWTSASLETVLYETIKLHLSAPEDQVVLQGPEIQLAPRAVLAITMSVHELCTNSLKYGALSVPHGRINLHWTLAERKKEPWLSITWRETGGPAISSPTVEGYGSRLLKSMIEGNLHGTTQRVFAGEGFKCVLSFPVPHTN